MKLVELLARELKEWPVVDGVEPNYIVQEGDKELYSTTIRPIYGGQTTWHRSPNDDAENCGYFDVATDDLAEDWTAAIVTRTDWESERARIEPAKKAGKDGWIRHRGGKCPVDESVKVQTVLRSETKRSFDAIASIAGDLRWKHHGDGGDIMAYRLHKPAEQVEACSKPDPRDSAKRDSDYVCWMRDRITEIDATTQALTTERAELVQKLAGEGFALIGRINDLLTEAAQKHDDMGDPNNWKHGDVLYCTSSDATGKKFIEGSLYVFESYTDGCSVRVEQDSSGEPNGMMPFALRWHSRPSA